jgi:transposase
MAADGSVSIFCFPPQRVPVSELDHWEGPAPPPTPRPEAPEPPVPQPRPTCSAPDCPHRSQLAELRQQAGYWKSMQQRSVARVAKLRHKIDRLKAKLRLREQQLFGRKIDSAPASNTPPDHTPPNPLPKPRARGQQPGQPGHKRRAHVQLPVVEETSDLPPEQQQCGQCGLPFAAFPGTEDVSILEVEVRAHRRLCHRRRYRPTCSCGCHPGIVTAPAPPRLIPKSTLGVSVWVTVLLDKFLYYRPTYRLLADLNSHGLDLSQGTLSDGLQRLLPLFKPLYDKLAEKQQQQHHWHADETRWLVFVTTEGKVGHRWYLWAFCSADVVVFVLSPGRDHEIPERHLGPAAQGILNVDRYAAYKAMAQVKAGKVLLAFCWAHVRRDFLGVARSWPKQEAWALAWVERIGELYRRNKARLQVQDDPLAFAGRDQAVRAWVQDLAEQRQRELAQPSLHPARRKVLESLAEHWTSLTACWGGRTSGARERSGAASWPRCCSRCSRRCSWVGSIPACG